MVNYGRVVTKNDLIKLFQALDLTTGSDVIVHSSMRTLGYVVNGALDVIDALIECVGTDAGTLLMPAHTGQLTDPSGWTSPSVPEEYVDVITRYMEPFNKKLTPVRNRGIIPSTFLSYPNVKRSSHPLNSVTSLGKKDKYFTHVHHFHESEGIESPIGRLYKADGKVLLIGVGLKKCTAIHLAEYMSDVYYLYENNPVVLFGRSKGVNKFIRINKYPGSSEYFDKVLPLLRRDDLLREVEFGLGTMTTFSIKQVVDYIVSILKSDPEYLIKK